MPSHSPRTKAQLPAITYEPPCGPGPLPLHTAAPPLEVPQTESFCFHVASGWLSSLSGCPPFFALLVLGLQILPQALILFFLFFRINFTYFWLRWVFVAAHRLSLVAARGGYSSLRCAGFSCSGFSCCGAWALGAQASVVVARGLSSCGSRALGCRLSSCGARA